MTTPQTPSDDKPTTLCEAFQRTASIDPSAVALRTIGGERTITWQEYSDQVRRLTAGLSALGIGHEDTVALMLTNRPEFFPIDTAVFHLGAIPFSMYNTSSPEQIAFLLENADTRVVVCEHQFLERVRAAGGPVEHIVVLDGESEGTMTLAELEAAGADDFDFEGAWRAVTTDDVATLIYTSGTTGPPKGVEITHANLVAEGDAIAAVVDNRFGDRTTSYLPSAHIADRILSHYSQIRHGLTITTVPDPKQIADALADCRPTVWGAVPRVWEKLKFALEAAFQEAEGPKAKLLHRALELGHKQVRAEQAGPEESSAGLNPLEKVQLRVLDKLVLSKIRAKLGFDELRWAASGAAAIAPETLEFFLALGIRVCEVWGMSETSAVATFNPPDAIKVGTVGKALPGVELRLADDGELLVRGDLVMRGYRKDPKRTAEALDKDGWLHTGDIATIDDEGYVKIVDRKKELIINAAGKNMSPSNIENAIKTACPLVGQAVTIGDQRPYNTALLVLDADAAAAYAEKAGLPKDSPAVLVEDPALVKTLTAGVATANAKLSRVEQIKRFRILPVFWEPGGDEITPTMKLKRRPIADKYATEIDALYTDTPEPGVYEASPA